jgi:arylsulfatase
MSYRISADVTIPENGAQGVIASFGRRDNGFAWYVKDGHLIYESKARGDHQVITSQAPLPQGDVVLAFEFVRDNADPRNWWEGSSGIGRLFVNGKLAGETKLQVSWPQNPALYIGQVAGSPVSNAFSPPFGFSGTLKQVKVELP